MTEKGLVALFKAIRMEAAYHVYFTTSWDATTKTWRIRGRKNFPAWYEKYLWEPS